MPYQEVCKRVQIRPPRKFTARDVARIIDRLRARGEINDAELLRGIADALGVADVICLIVRIADMLQVSFFLGALYALFKSIKTIIKGVKLLFTNKLAKTITLVVWFLEYILPAAVARRIALFFIWTGAIETALSLALLYISFIAESYSLIAIMRSVCEQPTIIQPIAQAIDIGDTINKMNQIKSEQEKLQEQLKEIY